MVRTILAVLAFFAFAGIVDAGEYRPPSDKKKAFSAYIVEVRQVLSAMGHTIKGRGGAHALIEVAPSGKITIVELKASDDGLRDRLRAQLAATRLPPPPSWMGSPVVFGVPLAFH
jgi:hypothetical protein